jgi:hypothetical protein
MRTHTPISLYIFPREGRPRAVRKQGAGLHLLNQPSLLSLVVFASRSETELGNHPQETQTPQSRLNIRLHV